MPETAYVLNTSVLGWNMASSTFSVYASDLKLRDEEINWPSKITVRSQRTGEYKVFHSPTIYTENGDLVHVTYRCEGMFLRIWND